LRPPLYSWLCAGGRALQGNENPAQSGTFISGNRLIQAVSDWLQALRGRGQAVIIDRFAEPPAFYDSLRD